MYTQIFVLFLPHRQRNPSYKPPRSNYYCKICKIYCQTAELYQKHIRRAHKKDLPEQGNVDKNRGRPDDEQQVPRIRPILPRIPPEVPRILPELPRVRPEVPRILQDNSSLFNVRNFSLFHK